MLRLPRAGLVALLTLLCGVIPPVTAAAQLAENLSSLFDEDNVRAYVEPLRQSLAAGLGNGIAPSGRVAGAGEWHARLSLQSIWIALDDDARTYRAQLPESFPATGSVIAPTVIGEGGGATFAAAGADSFTAIRFPGGFDLDRLAFAVPQLTLGTRGFEATIRWTSVDRGSTELGDFRMFGVGGRTDITWLLGRELPVNVAASVFYQQLEYGNSLIESDLLSYGIHVSRTFGRFEPYSALSFDSFDFAVDFEDASGERVTLEFERELRPRVSLGTVMHLPFFHLHGEIDFAEQFSTSLGFTVGL